MIKRIRIELSGLVQGVFFRASARAEAARLGLVGYASNQQDGTVKIVAEGEEDALKTLLAWCYNGSKFAKVKRVDAQWEEASGEFATFDIR